MYLIPIAWMYVVVMMTLVEASSPQGTWLGACITFLLYGLLPVSVMVYLMGYGRRKRQRQIEEHHDAS